ncbi:hypothetical protein D1AOALGA4SA_11663 [Olavius algarvensis Delta 1 endosymbiont]|nr:hypothetical protein D1AOALGA4SA_11663 [Olavius algarvensis Delta 1 endosymbiont]
MYIRSAFDFCKKSIRVKSRPLCICYHTYSPPQHPTPTLSVQFFHLFPLSFSHIPNFSRVDHQKLVIGPVILSEQAGHPTFHFLTSSYELRALSYKPVQQRPKHLVSFFRIPFGTGALHAEG